MVVDSYKEYVCRTATVEDAVAIYNLLESLVCDLSLHPLKYASQQRKLKMDIDFYIAKKDTLLVETEDRLMGVYLGEGNFILHIANRDNNIVSLSLLMYNVLCKIHNRYKDSTFIPLKHQDRYIFRTNMFKEDSIRDVNGTMYIDLLLKDKVEYLYKKLKGLTDEQI